MTFKKGRINYNLPVHRGLLIYVKTRIEEGHIKHDPAPMFNHYLAYDREKPYTMKTTKHVVGYICNDIGMECKKKPHGYVSPANRKSEILAAIDLRLGIVPVQKPVTALSKAVSNMTMGEMKQSILDEITNIHNDLTGLRTEREKADAEWDAREAAILASKEKAMEKLNNLNALIP